MQISSYDWFDGREHGRPCLVVGPAPTAADFPYASFKGVYLTCGDTPLRMRGLFTPGYWVNANNEFPVPEEHLETINGLPNTVFIFSDSVAYSHRQIDPEFLRDSLKVDWFAYDQRHFGGKPCKDTRLKCCRLLDLYPGRPTLQEFMQRRYGRPAHYSPGSTVAIHSLAFAILLGCNPIYLQGIELPRFAKDYAYWEPPPGADGEAGRVKLSAGNSLKRLGKTLLHKVSGNFFRGAAEQSPFFGDLPEILSDFEYLAELAADNGIKIYNLSPTSTLNEVRAIKLLSPEAVKG